MLTSDMAKYYSKVKGNGKFGKERSEARRGEGMMASKCMKEEKSQLAKELLF